MIDLKEVEEMKTFEYDGAPDSSNNCPHCGGWMTWFDLKPLDSPEAMECQECGRVWDIRTGKELEVK